MKPIPNLLNPTNPPINPVNNNLKAEEKIEIENQKIEQNSEKKQDIISLNQNQSPTPSPNQEPIKKVFKKIKDILPYIHVGFDGEESKENNQDNYFIFKNFADHKDYIYICQYATVMVSEAIFYQNLLKKYSHITCRKI